MHHPATTPPPGSPSGQPPFMPSVPLARGGPITDDMLAEMVNMLAEIPQAVKLDMAIVHALVVPCLRELQQRRTAMTVIAQMTRPGNVVFLDRPQA